MVSRNRPTSDRPSDHRSSFDLSRLIRRPFDRSLEQRQRGLSLEMPRRRSAPIRVYNFGNVAAAVTTNAIDSSSPDNGGGRAALRNVPQNSPEHYGHLRKKAKLEVNNQENDNDGRSEQARSRPSCSDGEQNENTERNPLQ